MEEKVALCVLEGIDIHRQRIVPIGTNLLHCEPIRHAFCRHIAFLFVTKFIFISQKIFINNKRNVVICVKLLNLFLYFIFGLYQIFFYFSKIFINKILKKNYSFV